ncbi:hypothetical protein ACVIRO_005365 [Rhizobium ruizarguesonis]
MSPRTQRIRFMLYGTAELLKATNGGPKVQVEIGHLPNQVGHDFASGFLRTIQTQGKSSRYYRNKAVSFESTDFEGTNETMRVHKLPAVSRDDVVLSKATMGPTRHARLRFC